MSEQTGPTHPDELSEQDRAAMSDVMRLLAYIDLSDLPVKGVDAGDMMAVRFEAEKPLVSIATDYPRLAIYHGRESKVLASLRGKMTRHLERWVKANGLTGQVTVLVRHHKIPEDYPTRYRMRGYVITVGPVDIHVPKPDHAWWDAAKDRMLRRMFVRMGAGDAKTK